METTVPNDPAAFPAGPASIYNPVTVTVNDSTGAVFLGVIALALLVAFIRAEARYRALLAQMAAAR